MGRSGPNRFSSHVSALLSGVGYGVAFLLCPRIIIEATVANSPPWIGLGVEPRVVSVDLIEETEVVVKKIGTKLFDSNVYSLQPGAF